MSSNNNAPRELDPTPVRRAMLDIETLSTQPDACIMSVGLAVFDDRKVVSSRFWALDYSREFNNRAGHISVDTMRWWLEQDRAVIERNLWGETPPERMLDELSATLVTVDELWANSPSFDCTILRNMYLRFDRKVPWHYRQERDCRTMFAIGRRLRLRWPTNDRKHDALADAQTQARYLLDIELALGLPGHTPA